MIRNRRQRHRRAGPDGRLRPHPRAPLRGLSGLARAVSGVQRIRNRPSAGREPARFSADGRPGEDEDPTPGASRDGRPGQATPRTTWRSYRRPRRLRRDRRGGALEQRLRSRAGGRPAGKLPAACACAGQKQGHSRARATPAAHVTDVGQSGRRGSCRLLSCNRGNRRHSGTPRDADSSCPSG